LAESRPTAVEPTESSAGPAVPAVGPSASGPPGAAGGRELADAQIAAFLDGEPPELIAFFGYGDGSHAAALRRRCGAPVVVYEPPAARQATAPGPPADVEIVGTLAELRAALAARADLSRCRLRAGAVPALRAALPEAFARFVEGVKQARVDAGVRQTTLAQSSALWLRHLAVNLPAVPALPPLDRLAGSFAGRPGVLVGAGPSLDGSLAALRDMADHVVICAASTALPALARAGITPAFVAAVEGNDLAGHFAGVPNLDRITLLPNPQGHPAHFAVPAGRRLAIAPQGSVVGDWLHRAWGRRQLDCGGSVACAGFSALHLMGCDPLVLIGMDLALTGGRTHADGTEQAARRVRWEPEQGRVYHWFEDKDATGHWAATTTLAWGGAEQVLTRPVFNSYRLWFEDAAETWAADRRLVNATGGGARIHGFAETPLATALPAVALSPLDTEAVIAAAVAGFRPDDPDRLWRQVAGELHIVAQAAAAAAQADRLAARALRDLTARRTGGLDALLGCLAAAESKLAGFTRATRLLNALVGERSQAVAHEAAPAAGVDPITGTAWSLRQSRRICGLVREAAAELGQLYGPLAANAGEIAKDDGSSPEPTVQASACLARPR
jgi:hypothetical protein